MKIGQVVQFSAPQMGLWDLCVSGSNWFKCMRSQISLAPRDALSAMTALGTLRAQSGRLRHSPEFLRQSVRLGVTSAVRQLRKSAMLEA